MSEKEYNIKGLTRAETVDKVPEDVLIRKRTTDYDKLLGDAKKKTIKLTLNDEKRALNVYLALRQKIKDRKMVRVVEVRRSSSDVYVFPARLAKGTP